MTPRSRRRSFRAPATLAAALVLLAGGCGGGGPLGNPEDVQNPPGTAGRKLAFAYYQRCIYPLLLAELRTPSGGNATCAGGGCHDNTTGTGGALRVVRGAATLDVTDPANTADVVRDSDMYRNYYSAQGVTIPGEALQSRLLAKPLLLNMLHGGGQIFENEDDPNAKLIQYWIEHPAPRDQDEFSTATYSMFSPADPNTGTCKTE
jgi:predicted small lipoprotein YifL